MKEKNNFYANNNGKRHIEITKHVMKRLKERVSNYEGFRNWQGLVRTARYERICEGQDD